MAFTEELRDPIAYAVPFFLLFIGIELVALRFLDNDPSQPSRRGYERRDTWTNLVMGIGSMVVNLVARLAALLLYAVLYVATPLRLDPHHWSTWIITILAVDLLWYSYHRSSHRIRILWAAHQAHHSSEYFNYSVALRQKWNPWGELIFWIPLPLLGVPPWMIFFAFSINLIYQFWVHTETIPKLPRPIEVMFNTPSHHRVHHAVNPGYLDRNYGGILIIWDRFFGTYAEEVEQPRYGVTKPVSTHNPFRLQYGEFAAAFRDVRRATCWHDRLGYLFAPPGWHPGPPGAQSLGVARR